MKNIEMNFMAAACYVFGILLCAPLLLFFSLDRELRFHAAQALFFHLALLMLFVPMSCIGVSIYLDVSKTLGTVVMGIATGYAVIMAVIWLYMIVQVLRGRRPSLIVLGRLAERAINNFQN